PQRSRHSFPTRRSSDLGLIAWITLVVERKKRPPKMAPKPSAAGWRRIFRGSWPLFAAAIALAVLNALTLMTRGSPWGITSAFARSEEHTSELQSRFDLV